MESLPVLYLKRRSVPKAAFFLAALGFVIYRVANLQKDLFRQNPSHPAVQREWGVIL
jgi:hypothetical protein